MSRKIGINPRLTLVGAGIGDPDLITVKGLKALRSADVVLYDALVSKELLEYAPTAEKVYVGKRVGQHSYSQEEINRLIVSHARSGGHVVRLKGGDPFIFGRGHEEMVYAEHFGIPAEYVPGISSSMAAAGLQHVPLTRRHISESLWIVTGTTKTGGLSKDVHLAAQSTATVVILMGMRKLEQIVRIFTEHGKESTAVAVIQNSSMPNEKVALGKVNTIVEEVQKKQMDSPAVIIIGNVVETHKKFPDQLRDVIGEVELEY